MWNNILASSIVLIVFIIIILIIAYILSMKNVRNQKKHFSDVHTSLNRGQKIIFSNGIHGVVKKVEDETVDVEIKSGSIMTISRYAISEIIK